MIPISIVQHPRVQFTCIRGNPLRTLYDIRPEILYSHEFFRPDQYDLPPRVVEMVDNRNTEGCNGYYSKSVHGISCDACRGQILTPEEEERLLHETSPGDRTMLEAHLPTTHPYVVVLRDRWTIHHQNDFQILL